MYNKFEDYDYNCPEFPRGGRDCDCYYNKDSGSGAYVALDEYNNIQGFLHVSEIATGWIRNVAKFLKVGEKKVLLVKRIDSRRSEIDLSLKQVSSDQKKKKLLEIKRGEKEEALVENLKTRINLSEADMEKLENVLVERFGSIYDAFSEVAVKGISILNNLSIPSKALTVIAELASKIQIPYVQIRGVFELTCNKSNGIEIIKQALIDSTANKKEVSVTYIGAPKYRITLTSPNFKEAEKELKPILSSVQDIIEKKGGTFKFTREESKKTREG